MQDFDARRLRQWELEATARRANAHLGVLQDSAENAMTHCVCVANHIEEAINRGQIPEFVGRELIREVASIDGAIGLYR